MTDKQEMRYLVLGSAGGLGQSFLERLGPDAVGLTRAQCDVTNRETIRENLLRYRPEVLFNASGYTAVDRAEADREMAFKVNATAVGTLAAECDQLGIRFVTFSTDYVFAGDGKQPLTESDPTEPRSIYGESKLEGERAALNSRSALVIRTSWLFSLNGKSFPRTILTKAEAGETLRIVTDQTSAPTYSPDLVEGTLALLSRNQAGLFHYSSAGETNWNAFAAEAIRLYALKIGVGLQMPAAIKTSDLNLAAARPAYSKLACDKALKAGIVQRPWQAAVADFVARFGVAGTL